MNPVKNLLTRNKIAADIEAFTFNPYSNQNIINEGNRLFKLGYLEDALVQYQTAYENEPDNENLVYNLGYLLYRLRDYKEALNYFTLAVDLKEDFTQAQEFKFALEAKLLQLSKYSMIAYR